MTSMRSILLAGTVSLFLATNASAACQTGLHTGQGYGATTAMSLKIARVAWRAKVINYYGVTYGLWSAAINRKESCKGTFVKSCKVWGTPCT
jgi:hypothetical protein